MAVQIANSASWVGSMRFAGIDIALKMQPADREDKIGLNMICPDHLARVEQIWQCNDAGEIVETPGRAVVRQLGDMERVIPISDDERRTYSETDDPAAITITETRSNYEFDPSWVAQTYWAWAEDHSSKVAMASLWRSLDRRNKIAIGSIVIDKRRHPVALRAAAVRRDGHQERHIQVIKLKWPEEVRVPAHKLDVAADPIETLLFNDQVDLMDRTGMPWGNGLVNESLKKMEKLIAEKENEYLQRELKSAVAAIG